VIVSARKTQKRSIGKIKGNAVTKTHKGRKLKRCFPICVVVERLMNKRARGLGKKKSTQARKNRRQRKRERESGSGRIDERAYVGLRKRCCKQVKGQCRKR